MGYCLMTYLGLLLNGLLLNDLSLIAIRDLYLIDLLLSLISYPRLPTLIAYPRLPTLIAYLLSYLLLPIHAYQPALHPP